MAQKQRDPISFPLHLSREVKRLFDEIIHRPWGCCREGIRGWNPSIDFYETEQAFIVEADLPGINLQDVTIKIEGGDLVLQGERSLEHDGSDGLMRRLERYSGRFLRRVKLPDAVDEKALEAEFSNGVLRVVVPKVRRQREETS